MCRQDRRTRLGWFGILGSFLDKRSVLNVVASALYACWIQPAIRPALSGLRLGENHGTWFVVDSDWCDCAGLTKASRSGPGCGK